jgi:DNA repair protein RadA/Sms
MAKPQKRYVCQACGGVATRWQGQCTDCGEWNSLVEEATNVTVFSAKHNLRTGGRAITLVGLDADVPLPKRASTGIAEFDRALGGGLVPGSATLIGGDPGIGKSTLLLQAAAKMSMAGIPVAYISGEEAADQVRLRARRLGYGQAPLKLASASSVRDILTTMAREPPGLLVIDSIQTMHSDQIEGAPGTVSQVRASAQELIAFAKESGTALVLVGHVTKDGAIAGPRVLEHMVDTVLAFEGERSHQYRILRAVKNRFGGTDEIGVFAMVEAGLEEVANPSALFLTARGEGMSGATVFPAMEGTRPVLVEIQALVVRLAERRHPAARGGRLGFGAAGDDPRGARGALRIELLDLRGLSQHRRRLSRRRPRRRSRGGGGAGVGARRAAGPDRERRVRRTRAVGRDPPGRARPAAPQGIGQARLHQGLAAGLRGGQAGGDGRVALRDPRRAR